ncbi:GNAT family N-acetyltransferase [Vibrio agarivorans]|uniref:GNAT family N-acetyltransferase n=1 Tax=Vibrio agarivorans TaxID=153622 RepID=A0ABT7XWS2_9VIBR|nr:GNAT family N-acetyltransferase [Vibrio agarivorans]MDN2479989.1 GNAT family N-acetyltransferase [Vibrio agarivorans]
MLTSKTITLRLVEESDADFIVSLRTDDKYNKYLSTVGSDVDAQRKWISSYKEKERNKNEYYFIIQRNDGVRCGTVRVYDLKEDSFCWGSWILNEDKTRYAAVESALLVYEFGFKHLGFNQSHFEVVKGNTKVIDFHKKFGAEQVDEDADHFYFTISRESVAETKIKFSRIIK